MRSIPTWFFATAAFCALIGMAWGIQMSATQDHTLSPAHGHLNLIGFVVMSVFGTYYALTPRAAETRFSLIHYGLVTATVLILTPGIVFAVTGQGETLAKIGAVLGVLSMTFFAFMILRYGVGAGRGGDV
jgi:cbb3-type cytochrome oxidase subunit 1